MHEILNKFIRVIAIRKCFSLKLNIDYYQKEKSIDFDDYRLLNDKCYYGVRRIADIQLLFDSLADAIVILVNRSKSSIVPGEGVRWF